MKETVVAQITDLHIEKAGINPYEVDVRENFERIIKAIQNEKIDLLVITGDLCFRTGKRDIYSWIREKLRRAGLPHLVIPGNHDDVLELAREFDLKEKLKEGELYFKIDIGLNTFLFLDSSGGSLSKRQLKWLEKQISNCQNSPVIFMHHPPVFGGVFYMDQNYSLKEKEQVQEILINYGRTIPVFCGHYHVEKTVVLNNILVFITPSTFFQIDQKASNFKVQGYQIGWRKIVFYGDDFQTNVFYPG